MRLELGYGVGHGVAVAGADHQPAGDDGDHRPPPLQLRFERVVVGRATDRAGRREHRAVATDREIHGIIVAHVLASPNEGRSAATNRHHACVPEHGRVGLRPFDPSDEAALLAGRDDEWRRWLGPNHDHPRPSACIVVDDEVVGWIDADPNSPQLAEGETNIGYSVFAAHRGKGYATEALLLLVHHLRTDERVRTATMKIDPRNHASLRVAAKVGFDEADRTASSVRFRLRLR